MSVTAKFRHAKFAVATALLALSGTATAQNHSWESEQVINTLMAARRDRSTDTEAGMEAFLKKYSRGHWMPVLRIWRQLGQPGEDFLKENIGAQEVLSGNFRNYNNAARHPHVRRTVMSYRNDPVGAATAMLLVINFNDRLFYESTRYMKRGERGTWGQSAAGLGHALDSLTDGPVFLSSAISELANTDLRSGVNRNSIVSLVTRAENKGTPAPILRTLFSDYFVTPAENKANLQSGL